MAAEPDIKMEAEAVGGIHIPEAHTPLLELAEFVRKENR
jgi:hypothetical protein